jgi:hypothetical protein
MFRIAVGLPSQIKEALKNPNVNLFLCDDGGGSILVSAVTAFVQNAQKALCDITIEKVRELLPELFQADAAEDSLFLREELNGFVGSEKILRGTIVTDLEWSFLSLWISVELTEKLLGKLSDFEVYTFNHNEN